jgi:hypothetical protein
LQAVAQGQQGHGAGRPDGHADEHVEGVVGAGGELPEADQQRGRGRQQPPAAGGEQQAGCQRRGDRGLRGEERAVAAARADGMHGRQRPVGAGPEVEVVDELVQGEAGQRADGGQGQHGQGLWLAAADGTGGHPQQGQRRHGQQPGRCCQGEQAGGLVLGEAVGELGDRLVKHPCSRSPWSCYARCAALSA